MVFPLFHISIQLITHSNQNKSTDFSNVFLSFTDCLRDLGIWKQGWPKHRHGTREDDAPAVGNHGNFSGKDLPPEPDVYHESYAFQDVNHIIIQSYRSHT